MKRSSQSGLALITVLLIFALVSVMAIAMVQRQSQDIQRSANAFTMQQARAYTYAAEAAIKSGLYLSWSNDKNKDHINDEWAQPRTFPLEPGTARIEIQDAQGRFNLNSLHPSSANRTVQAQRFTNLLNLLGLDVDYAAMWSRWLDENSQEDNRYQAGREQPYRAAYQACQHVSEVLLLDGMDRESYQRLEPYISCLPFSSPLNVNTATAAVLAALDVNLTLADGQSIVDARGDKGFSTLDDFWSLSVIEPYTRPRDPNESNEEAAKRPDPWEKTDFSIRSDYFEAFARIDLNDRVATLSALIHRRADDGTMTTVYRDFGRREARLRESPLLESTQPMAVF
ncbi:MAG: type II secretion system minor pseudopilin GspK [Bacterioplanes sp.]|nr:type II secretion system minor pseudopilin GspK [Bacterioplanes sp.]